MLLLSSPVLLTVLVFVVSTSPVLSVNECMCKYYRYQSPRGLNPPYFSAGKQIDCFDCNSNEDPRCGDPFVFTAHARDMPAVKQCDGCCVKLVQHRGTGNHYNH